MGEAGSVLRSWRNPDFKDAASEGSEDMGSRLLDNGEGPLLCGCRKLVTLLSAVIWKAEHMPIKLSDPAKVMSKLSVGGTVGFPFAAYVRRYTKLGKDC